ncbi:hypothetical protein C8R42DRAFT_682489 [Lentinula raphanica]|nr:hypothetical protein C8R42DRAFT_682489 [Lentinula raphanica]
MRSARVLLLFLPFVLVSLSAMSSPLASPLAKRRTVVSIEFVLYRMVPTSFDHPIDSTARKWLSPENTEEGKLAPENVRVVESWVLGIRIEPEIPGYEPRYYQAQFYFYFHEMGPGNLKVDGKGNVLGKITVSRDQFPLIWKHLHKSLAGVSEKYRTNLQFLDSLLRQVKTDRVVIGLSDESVGQIDGIIGKYDSYSKAMDWKGGSGMYAINKSHRLDGRISQILEAWAEEYGAVVGDPEKH